MIRSPRFRISPRVHVTWPTSWKAITGAPWQYSASVSMQPPTQSAIATARRWASLVVSFNPKMSGYRASRRIRAARSMPSSSVAGWPSTRQGGLIRLRPVQEPRLAEAACIPGFDDAIPVDSQGDVIAEAAAEGACGILDDGDVRRSGHLSGLVGMVDFEEVRGLFRCRVNLHSALRAAIAILRFRCPGRMEREHRRHVLGDRRCDARVGGLGCVAIVNEYQFAGIGENPAQVMECEIAPQVARRGPPGARPETSARSRHIAPLPRVRRGPATAW